MPELGNKYECAECGAKFYDLGNAAAVCPKCGTAPKRDADVEPRKVPLARLPDVEEDEPEVVVPDEDAAVEEVGEEIEEEEEAVVETGDDD